MKKKRRRIVICSSLPPEIKDGKITFPEGTQFSTPKVIWEDEEYGGTGFLTELACSEATDFEEHADPEWPKKDRRTLQAQDWGK